jgi:hypothetical protein
MIDHDIDKTRARQICLLIFDERMAARFQQRLGQGIGQADACVRRVPAARIMAL